MTRNNMRGEESAKNAFKPPRRLGDHVRSEAAVEAALYLYFRHIRPALKEMTQTALVLKLNERGIRTVQGCEWSQPTMSVFLKRVRKYENRVVYKPQVYTLSKCAKLIGINQSYFKNLYYESILHSENGGKFNETEVLIGRIVVALFGVGLDDRVILQIAGVFRQKCNYPNSQLSLSPRRIDTLFKQHEKWGKRVQCARRGQPIYLVVTPELKHRRPEDHRRIDPNAFWVFYLARQGELAKVLAQKCFENHKAAMVLDLVHLWKGL